MKSPRALGLPYPDWRLGQRLAILECLHSTTTHTVCCAPTGSGKSAIAAALPRLDPDSRYVTLTATKALMDQYNATFPFLVDLRGASNYPCRAARDEFKEWFPVKRRHLVACDDGPCHVGMACTLKDSGCTYYDARRDFVAAQAGLTNYAAWLANRRVGQSLGTADKLLCDEAHTLLEELMGACRVDIPHHLLDSHRIPRGYKGWARWAEERLKDLAPSKDDDLRVKRERIERGLRMMAGMDHTWAWDEDDHGYHFEPTVPRRLLPLLQTFDGTSKVIYLSATITPTILDLLDIDPDDVTFHTMTSTFDPQRRPIYILPGARVDHRSMKDAETRERWVDAIDLFCEVRNDRRGLIHSVSYARARDIVAASGQRHRMMLHDAREPVADIVARFLQSAPNTILVSPSVMTGFNFPYHAAEFQLIVKLPFPDTRSNIMRARIRATPRYRDVHTMTRLVQACGRLMRAEDDQGETAIIDQHFGWWWEANRDLAPEWFSDAIVRTRRRVQPFPKLAA